jgi:predicted metal-dependent enzyme (double-stranded beta helix superfamily)
MPLDRLRDFVADTTRVLDGAGTDDAPLDRIAGALAQLVAIDDWLPDDFARPDPTKYQQYLLHCDPLERFSVVSFVWGPGQATPIHDHTVWGLIGVLRGSELSQAYDRDMEGRLQPVGDRQQLNQGEIERVSPSAIDIHQVSNALTDRASISIHIYGGNIGRIERHVFDRETGSANPFISAYSNRTLPNLWA